MNDTVKTAVIGGTIGAAAYGLYRYLQQRGDATNNAKTQQSLEASLTSSSFSEDLQKADHAVMETTYRMRGAQVPPTPLDLEAKAKQMKGSLAYVSAVANALGDMTRDKHADAFMDMAVEEASMGVVTREGGPFGAVVMKREYNAQGQLEERVIARGHNMVLQSNDPTAHAEVTAIRKACARLGTFDLSDCVLYTSCYPCPMCYGAIHWAKIPKCIYAAEADDAAAAGFDDAFIYESIRGTALKEHCDFEKMQHKGAIDVFSQNYDRY